MGVKRVIKRKEDSCLDLKDLFDDFINEKEAKGLSSATIFSYEKSFKKFYEFLGDRNTTDEINQSTIYAFIARMKEDEISFNSINHYLREIRAFMSWCFDRDFISKFEITLVKGQEVVKETYTDEELNIILAKPKKNCSFAEFRTWTIINWVLATGNRAETVCSATLGCLNFTKKEIALEHTKNKKAQVIPMSSSLEGVLKEYIRYFRREASHSDYLFCDISGGKLTTNALRHSFRKYNLDRGVEKTSIHALRHTFAKHWILNTGDVFRLQKMLGHSTLEMTRKYVNMFDDDIKENFDSYNPLDRLKKGVSRKQKIKKYFD